MPVAVSLSDSLRWWRFSDCGFLLSWERKNITSKEQVEEEQKRRKKQFMQKENLKQTNGPVPKIPMHNWLEGE